MMLRWGAAALLVAAWILLSWRAWRQAHARRRPVADPAGWLVIHASQSGQAQALAEQSATVLQAAGQRAQTLSLNQADAALLARATHALFIASTSGEGDAPDGAAHFVQRVMPETLALGGLRYALLALGDSSYKHFCGFGRQLDQWLMTQGARPLAERIEADRSAPTALQRWQRTLSELTGASPADWQPPAYTDWRLAVRRLLNPGSAGGPCYLIELRPLNTEALQWQAGDIAEIAPRSTPQADLQAPRDYSIASLPADGCVQLLVRQQRNARGEPGLGSGWLTERCPIDGKVALRLRSNPGFHLPPGDFPLVLIGNGTGLAGLRAWLKARAARGHGRNWLVFGERHADHDALLCDELQDWQRQGLLPELDLVYSRQGQGYVQDRLRQRAALLREWVGAGAVIALCGSLQGMARGVDQALEDILGAQGLQTLRADGRVRRDVY
ncbi:oxidoreductase [Bordetella trematum]|uniref:NADPH--hemoprotein reductase n=1 Tax=Bordetella trematum TaxID=123899 RepID=A0A157SV82_9BORD|nr:sulfite reductase subunit alpha [Bordetella trematum]AZR94799.1 oxidoreductase [Bordetella trematum]NNH20168.1 oxidoreductase [Bordetella trematum]SAH95382.1 oxidoreductase [Bordetella trematum]SAI74241.1 oxidoreductase [Bordetella trematum]SUV96934.1 oxidoreductase [Bordetella trematum]